MRIKFYYDNPERIKNGMEPIEGPDSVDVPVADQMEEIKGEMAGYAEHEEVLRGKTVRGIMRAEIHSVALLVDGTIEEVIAVLNSNAETEQEAEMRRRENAEEYEREAAEKLVAETAEVEEWIALPVEKRVRKYSNCEEWTTTAPGCTVPALVELYELAVVEAKTEVGRRNAGVAEEGAAARAKKEAEEVARQAAILAMLIDHGTASQVERYEAGVLPEKEIKAIVRKLLMGALNDAGFDRYEPIGDAVEHADYCPEDCPCDVHYTEDPLETLSANQWANLKCARELAPDCTVSPVLHRAWASCNEDVETTRYALSVKGKMLGIKVSRNYELTDEPITGNLITDADNQEARR